MESKKFINLKEAGDILGVSRETVRKLCTLKDFPCTKLKRRFLIDKEKLVTWVNENNMVDYY